MGEPSSRPSVVLGNKIQGAIAQAVLEHEIGPVASAVVVIVDVATYEVQEITVVPESQVTDICLLYEDKIKK
jgi:hypothetical protein